MSIIGGHSIDDYPPKYGLAVIGTVHPDRIITNAGAREETFSYLPSLWERASSSRVTG
ncbi:MAG: hypothetical protein MZV63_32710 [Marinilabiliales bacterium]|nr:hypothetical protein [Marinilabiliales bacterium]